MGIKERQERDREAVRRAILDAARDLFVSEGYNNVSMRKIAERIEYSPASIYSYFPSKDDIFFERAEEGFRLLSDPARAGRPDLAALAPLDRVRATFSTSSSRGFSQESRSAARVSSCVRKTKSDSHPVRRPQTSGVSDEPQQAKPGQPGSGCSRSHERSLLERVRRVRKNERSC